MESKKPPSAKKSSLSKRQASFNSSSKENQSHDATQLNITAPSQHNTSLKGSKIVTSTPAVGSVGVLPVHGIGNMTAPTPILAPGQAGGRGVSPRLKGHGVSPHVRGAASKTTAKDEEKVRKPAKIKAPLLPQKQFENLTKHKGHEVSVMLVSLAAAPVLSDDTTTPMRLQRRLV